MNDDPQHGQRAMPHGSESSPSHNLLPHVMKQAANNNAALVSTALQMVAQVNQPDYLITLGRSLLAAGEYAMARQHLARATRLDPQAVDAWQCLGEACRHLGLDDEAIAAWTKVVQLRPQAAESHAQLGDLYRRQGRVQEAKAHLFRAAQLAANGSTALPGTWRADLPHSPWLPLAQLSWDQGKVSEALEYYDRAFTGQECDARSEYLRGLIALAREQWHEGWRRFEYRRVLRRHLPQGSWPHPIWDGDCRELHHQTILVHSEGKLADDILFAAWLPELIHRSGKTIIKCEPPLTQLFARSFPQAVVTTAGLGSRDIPHADWQTALGSLPRHLGMDAVAACSVPVISSPTPLNVPGARGERPSKFARIDGSHTCTYSGYLVAEWKLQRQWQRRVEILGRGRKIGLAGWTLPGQTNAALWQPLWDVPYAQWLLLDPPTEHDDENKLPGHVHRLRALPRRKDVDDWAALLTSLDLVITPPGLIAHLAGAFGVPVWVLTPTLAPWCWGVQGERSRWYPTARLFRQQTTDRWDDVVARVAETLTG